MCELTGLPAAGIPTSVFERRGWSPSSACRRAVFELSLACIATKTTVAGDGLKVVPSTICREVTSKRRARGAQEFAPNRTELLGGRRWAATDLKTMRDVSALYF